MYVCTVHCAPVSADRAAGGRPGTSTLNQLEKVCEIIGKPTDEQIKSMQASAARRGEWRVAGQCGGLLGCATSASSPASISTMRVSVESLSESWTVLNVALQFIRSVFTLRSTLCLSVRLRAISTLWLSLLEILPSSGTGSDGGADSVL